MRPAMDQRLAGLRIGAYARFSSDKQSETSASAQIARLQQWVQARGGQLCLGHTYRDEGISGARNQRPGLISLMAAVDSGELDVVVVEDLSRLSRDIEHSASMRKRFAFSGVRLIGIADGIDTLGNGGDLLYGVKSILSEQYLKDLGDKTSRGLRDRAQTGRVTGALPYGYTSATAADGQGKVPVIVAAQAAVVRRIFRMRAVGRSYRDIAKALNDEGVPPPRGRRRIRESGAMGGPCLESARCSRTRSTPGAGPSGLVLGRRAPRRASASCGRPSLRSSRSRCPSFRILDEETWSRVQAINEQARERHATVGPSAYAREGGARTARRVYPLSTLIRCGVCGGPMVIEKTQKPRYRCDASRGNGGTCENSRTLMEEALREALTSALLRYFDRPEVIGHLIETARAELAKLQRTVPDERTQAEKALAATRAGIDNLVELASTGTAPASILEKKSVGSRSSPADRFAALKSWEPCSRHSTYPGPRMSSRELSTSARSSTRAPRTREKHSSISSTMAFSSTPLKTGATEPAGPSAEAPFSLAERQSPRCKPRALKSGCSKNAIESC